MQSQACCQLDIVRKSFHNSLVGQGHGRVPLKIQDSWALRLFDIHGEGRIKPDIFELAFQQTQWIAARVAHHAHGAARVAQVVVARVMGVAMTPELGAQQHVVGNFEPKIAVIGTGAGRTEPVTSFQTPVQASLERVDIVNIVNIVNIAIFSEHVNPWLVAGGWWLVAGQ